MTSILLWLRRWNTLVTNHACGVSIKDTRTYEGWLLTSDWSFRTARTRSRSRVVLALESQCCPCCRNRGFTRTGLGWADRRRSHTIVRQLWRLCSEALGLARAFHNGTTSLLSVKAAKILLIFFKESVLISCHHRSFLLHLGSIFEGWMSVGITGRS